jgi:hypothetical protein
MTEVIYVDPTELVTCCKAAIDAGLSEDDPRLEDVVLQASEIIYNMTGRQFAGTQNAKVRPWVPCTCGWWYGYAGYPGYAATYPILPGYPWGAGSGCCCFPPRINLGFWPVTTINQIWYNGQAQPLTDFHLDNYRWLVRNDGLRFPGYSNNMYAEKGGPLDNVNDGFVFEVDLDYGVEVPRLIKRATRELACSLLNECLCADDKSCKTPDRVNNISRQGVSISLIDPLDILREGGTGIYAVDLAIRTYNPSKLQSPSFVWAPDLSGSRQRIVN